MPVSPVGIGLYPPIIGQALGAPDVTSAINAIFPGFAAGSIELGVARFTLTVTQRQNIVGTPVVVVPGVAGRIAFPITFVTSRATGAAGAAASGAGSFRWSTAATTPLTGAVQLCALNPNRNDFDIGQLGGIASASLAAPATVVGASLQISGTNQTGGAGSTFEGWLAYLLTTFP